MRLYLDLCCLNRPFDDQTQVRIRLESEALLSILEAVSRGEHLWISSEALRIESIRNPDLERRSRILMIAGRANETAALSPRSFERARALEALGFGAFDALHLAAAEHAGVDVFLTTDDRLLKLGERHRRFLQVDVQNPLRWAGEALR